VEVSHPLLPSTLFLQQALLEAPQQLELTVAGEVGSVLAVTRSDERTTTHILTRAYETVRVPIPEQEPLAVQVQQKGDADITLVAVRVVGGE
jgi:tRNA(Ser,Leu) C12 N-acetylase TAN1